MCVGTQLAAYLKVLALLVPREHKVEHSNSLKKRGGRKQLEAGMIAYLRDRLESAGCGGRSGHRGDARTYISAGYHSLGARAAPAQARTGC